VLISAARFTMDRRDYVVVNARDVTAPSRRGSSTRRSSSAPSIGIALTRDRRFVQANPRFEAIFGWPAGELGGQPARRSGRRRRLRRGGQGSPGRCSPRAGRSRSSAR
jgi:PAS domain-containing protein